VVGEEKEGKETGERMWLASDGKAPCVCEDKIRGEREKIKREKKKKKAFSLVLCSSL